MTDSLSSDLSQGLSLLGISIIFFVLAKIIKDFLTPYSIDKELNTDNLAASISLCGYQIATIIILLGALLGPSKGILEDIYSFCGYSLLGILLLNVSRFINDKLILRKFSNVDEIVRDRNAGTGAVEFGSYLASGLVVAGSIHGTGGGLETALVFFLLSQLALILFVFIYDLITPYDIHHEIEEDNISAGVAFGGTLTAVGIIMLKGSAGNFISWTYNISNFGVSVISSFIFLPLIRIFLDKIILPKTDLNKAIKENRNIAMGLLEMTIAISFAVILYYSIDFNFSFGM
jgi:uncharacterized membrane protein YjfL (UPF0719 family)